MAPNKMRVEPVFDEIHSPENIVNPFSRLNDIELDRAVDSWLRSNVDSMDKDSINNMADECSRRGLNVTAEMIRNRKE